MIDRRSICVACAVVVALLACSLRGANWMDTGGEDHLWSNPDSWMPVGLPGEADDVIIDNAGGFGPVIDGSVVALCNRLYLGDFKGPCNLTIAGGTLTQGGFCIISSSPDTVGTVTMTDGLWDDKSHLFVGFKSSDNGVLTMNGGNLKVGGGLYIPRYEDSASAYMQIDGGLVEVAGLIQVMDSLEITGGTLVQNSYCALYSLPGKTGTITMSDGVWDNRSSLVIGVDEGDNVVFTMMGGTLNIGLNCDIAKRATVESAHVQLDGGVINIGASGQFTIGGYTDSEHNSNGSMDITNGIMRLEENRVASMGSLWDRGLMTAFGGQGRVVIEYDPKTNVTTVSATLDVERAGNPRPGNREEGVQVDAVLHWTAGQHSSAHDVYFGTTLEDVNVADTTSPVYQGRLTTTTYAPAGPLMLGQTYYWRIDEIRTSDPATPLKGDVWQFTVRRDLVLDDFEDYNDFSPDRVFDAWMDGWNIDENGAEVGYSDPDFDAGQHFMETHIIHGGGQSMPLFYNNESPAIHSEASVTLESRQMVADWAATGATDLSLWFYGDPNNAIEPMYVALEDSAGNIAYVAYNGEGTNLTKTSWQEWLVMLQRFTDAGVDLAHVSKFYVAFGGAAGSASAGGSGFVYLDDIRLTIPAPVVPPAPVTGIIAHWMFDEDSGTTAHDETGDHDATVNTDAAWSTEGRSGGCLRFDGTVEVAVPSALFDEITDQVTVAFWQYTENAAGSKGAPFSVYNGSNVVARTLHPWPQGTANASWWDTGDGTGTTDRLKADLGLDIFEGQWNHWAFTKNASAGIAQIYMNGELIAEATDQTKPFGSATQVLIGALTPNKWRTVGLLDDVRVYDYALSNEEIRDVMDMLEIDAPELNGSGT